MIYKNTSHTAQEVIDALGVNPFVLGEQKFARDEVIGKVRVRIGGIAGITDPEKVVKIGDDNKVEVIVGNKAYDLKVSTAPKGLNGISEEARGVLDQDGKELTKKFEALQEAKAEARAKAEAEEK